MLDIFKNWKSAHVIKKSDFRGQWHENGNGRIKQGLKEHLGLYFKVRGRK